MRAVLCTEPSGLFLTLLLIVGALMSSAMLINGFNCFPGDIVNLLAVAQQRAVLHLCRNAAQHDRVGKAAHSVCTTTEADQIDPVALLVMIDDDLVAVCHVLGDAATGHRLK